MDDEIIVTRLGSIYSVTYYKPDKSPQLLAKRISDHDDLRFEMTAAEFLTQAWRLANLKARESAGSRDSKGFPGGMQAFWLQPDEIFSRSRAAPVACAALTNSYSESNIVPAI